MKSLRASSWHLAATGDAALFMKFYQQGVRDDGESIESENRNNIDDDNAIDVNDEGNIVTQS